MMLKQKKIMNLSIKNGIWMYLLQFFNTVVPLLTLPYITRVLTASQYGEFSIALNFIGYMQVIVEYGFGMSATRKVVTCKRDKEKINKIFTSVLMSRIFLLFICIFFYVIYGFYSRKNEILYICTGILLLCPVGYCIQQNWLFQGMQEMKFISIINIISRLVSVVFIFCFVKNETHLFLYCFFYSLSPLISAILGFIIVHKKYHVHLVRINLIDIWNEIKNGWYVFTTQLSSKIFVAIGITFLGFFSDTQEVGIYSAIYKIPNIILLAWSPISQVMYPNSSSKMQKSFIEGKKYVLKNRKLVMPFFGIAVMVIALFSEKIVEIFFGAEYTVHYYWILPLLLWILVAINNNFWGIQILLGSGHDKEYSSAFMIGVVCTISFNFIFIYLWGGMGAALAPLVSESILGIALNKKIHQITRKYKE